MSNDAARHLMLDLSRELLEMARKARSTAKKSGDAYDKGRQFALYEVVSLLKLQAKSFGVELSTLGLEGLDPARDLLD